MPALEPPTYEKPTQPAVALQIGMHPEKEEAGAALKSPPERSVPHSIVYPSVVVPLLASCWQDEPAVEVGVTEVLDATTLVEDAEVLGAIELVGATELLVATELVDATELADAVELAGAMKLVEATELVEATVLIEDEEEPAGSFTALSTFELGEAGPALPLR